MNESVTIYLRDYLSPGGRKPYASLASDMQAALSAGKEVCLISVPGFLMVRGDPQSLREGYWPWSDCAGLGRTRYYVCASDAVRGVNGSRRYRRLNPKPRKPRKSFAAAVAESFAAHAPEGATLTITKGSKS